MGTKTIVFTKVVRFRADVVKKESPYMGTKTMVIIAGIGLIELAGEKRIPIHGDENRFITSPLSAYVVKTVKKESPYMGTKTILEI